MRVGPSTYSPMGCVQSHAYSWMSMAVCLLKSNKYMLFKYLGVFQTVPVDPDILIVNVQQLLYHILWPYGSTTTESIASHQSCLNVYLSAKVDKRLRKTGPATVEMWKQQAHVSRRLAAIFFLSRSWINRRWCIGPSGWRSRYHHGLLCTRRCPFWQEYHQCTQRWHRCVGIASLLVPSQSTYKWRVEIALGLTSMQYVLN